MVSQPESSGGSALERILEAAIDLFGRQGVHRTSIRAIAEQAGVSPPLVMHHFGSKAALRQACDEWVVAFIHDNKTASIHGGPSLPLAELQGLTKKSRPAIRYLARSLIDGSPSINTLIDDMVDSAVDYSAQAEAAGVMLPSTDRRSRIVVLTLWMLGPLLLHEHLHRLMGVDLLDDSSDLMPYMGAALEILTGGVIPPGTYPDLGSAGERKTP